MKQYSYLEQGFMRRALELAGYAQQHGEVPVGAVLVEDGKIIGEGSNAPISSNDASAHAEINAIRAACHVKQNYRLPNTQLYVTLEPCAMCAGALIHARVERVLIGATEPRAGAAGSALNVLQNEKLNHRCDVEFGLMAEQSATMLKAFFKSRR
ncbi:MAG: tRNA(adenine34) deaminase [Dinoroseobacter sp.]|jgi:tRNA(adenine34) deaminase